MQGCVRKHQIPVSRAVVPSLPQRGRGPATIPSHLCLTRVLPTQPPAAAAMAAGASVGRAAPGQWPCLGLWSSSRSPSTMDSTRSPTVCRYSLPMELQALAGTAKWDPENAWTQLSPFQHLFLRHFMAVSHSSRPTWLCGSWERPTSPDSSWVPEFQCLDASVVSCIYSSIPWK